MIYLFFIFIFGTLSFGRAFSTLHIDTPIIPLFVTEIFIFIGLIWLILNPVRVKYLKQTSISKIFISFLFIFFLFGFSKLIGGCLARNPFVFRDLVLVFYILLLPLTYIFMDNIKQLKLFLAVLILSNIVALLIGRFLFFDIFLFDRMNNFISRTKSFNLGLYYGVTVSFLVPMYFSLKNKLRKFVVIFILVLNVYMLFAFGERTLWFAVLSLVIYFLVVYGRKLLKILAYFLLLASILIPIFIYCDSIHKKDYYSESIFGKTKSLILFLSGKMKWDKPDVNKYLTYQVKDSAGLEINNEIDDQIKSGMDNIVWRLIVWKDSIKFGLSSPIFGKGFGVYPDYKIWGYRGPLRIDMDSNVVPAHNHLVTVFYKMGLLGLILFLWINVYVFLYGFRHINKAKSEFTRNFLIGALGAFVFWHSMALFFDVIDSPPTSIFLWIIMGIIFAVIEIDRNGGSQNIKECKI